jgi:hypothetical protein
MSAELLPCPLCGTDQIQVCTDANNPMKDYCRCRECKCTGPLSRWNTRATAAASQAQPAQQGDMRAAFEAQDKHRSKIMWKRGGTVFAEGIPPENYVDPGVQAEWESWQRAWQAARSAPRPVLTDGQLEDLVENSGGRWADGEFRIDGADFGKLLRAVREGGGNG